VPDGAGALAGRSGGDHLHDSGAAGPVGLDLLRSLFGTGIPGGVAAVPFLVILCSKRDVAFPWNWAPIWG